MSEQLNTDTDGDLPKPPPPADPDDRILSVGHNEDGERVRSGLRALRVGLVRRDRAIKDRSNAFFSEALSDSPSFGEVTYTVAHSLAEMSLKGAGHGIFPTISAAAALYMLSVLNSEQRKDNKDLNELLDIWTRYRDSFKDKDKTKEDREAILAEAGLSLEGLPDDIDPQKDFDLRYFLNKAGAPLPDHLQPKAGETAIQRPKITLTNNAAVRFTKAAGLTVFNVLRSVPGNVRNVHVITRDVAKALKTYHSIRKEFKAAAEHREKPVSTLFEDESRLGIVEEAATGDLDLTSLKIDDVEVLGQQHDIAPKTVKQIQLIRRELSEEIESLHKNGVCLHLQSLFIMANLVQAAFINAPTGNPLVVANLAGASMALEPLKEFAHSVEASALKIKSKLAEEAEQLARLASLPDIIEERQAAEEAARAEAEENKSGADDAPVIIAEDDAAEGFNGAAEQQQDTESLQTASAPSGDDVTDETTASGPKGDERRLGL